MRLAVAGTALAAGAIVLLAGPAMANDSSHGAKGAGGADSGFAGGPPSKANDVTPAGVPVYGLLDSVAGIPSHIVPGVHQGNGGGGY